MARATSIVGAAGTIHDALDPTRSPAELVTELERSAATNVQRVVRARPDEPEWTGAPIPHRMLSFVETKTVWHPIGG